MFCLFLKGGWRDCAGTVVILNGLVNIVTEITVYTAHFVVADSFRKIDKDALGKNGTDDLKL